MECSMSHQRSRVTAGDGTRELILSGLHSRGVAVFGLKVDVCESHVLLSGEVSSFYELQIIQRHVHVTACDHSIEIDVVVIGKPAR